METGKNKWKLVVGLGNPGSQYKRTYHNIGKIAVDIWSKEDSFEKPFSIWKNKPFEFVNNDNIFFIKPTTYMNESGKAVLSAMNHFKINPDEIIIVQDDSDMEIGRTKLSHKGSSGGHKGIESVIHYLKTDQFDRIKIGIRNEKNAGKKALDFVLSEIPKEEFQILEKLITDLGRTYFE